MSTWLVEREKPLSFPGVLLQYFQRNFISDHVVYHDTIEIDTKGIHPRFIEIMEDDEVIIIKGVDYNNLSYRLNYTIQKSDFASIDKRNIAYRAGKIIFRVNISK